MQSPLCDARAKREVGVPLAVQPLPLSPHAPALPLVTFQQRDKHRELRGARPEFRTLQRRAPRRPRP